MALVTLQMILQDAFPAYEQTHPLPAHVRKVAHALMQCRTAALGGHIQACPDGHVTGVWYNSCRPRSCPQCAFLQTERWLRLQQARLLACDHYHVIFTLPHDLNPLWLANVQVMTTLLFQAVRDTLCTLLADPKYLGAQPGILAALHTWSQTLVLHPHVHCLVTGGGLTPMGQWVAVRNGFLLPARVVMAVFRGKLLAAIRQALAREELRLPEGIRPQQMLNLLMRLGHPRKTKWNVHIMERYRHGAGVVTYLARYLRGGPIKNARLVACNGDRVTFTCRARHDAADGDRPAAQRLTLSVADFLQRWLLHVPVPQTRVVRCYGLYHPTHASALAVCRHGTRATAGGGASGSGLADGVLPGWRYLSGAVPHVRAGAGVHGHHPAGRSSSPPGLRGVSRMRSASLERPARGVVCSVAARGRGQRPGGSKPGRPMHHARPLLRLVWGRQSLSPAA